MKKRLKTRGFTLVRLSKAPVKFCRRSGESSLIRFLRRHVRGRKHLSACRSLSVKKGSAFFDKLARGFTLVELVASLALLAIVMTAFTVLATSASAMNLRAQERKQALEDSVNQAEEGQVDFVSRSYLTIELWSGTDLEAQMTVDVNVYETPAGDPQLVTIRGR